MSNEIVLSERQQNAWLKMAAAKNQLTETLSGLELKAQGLLLPIKNSNDYAAIDAAIADYKKVHAEMIEKRKHFTTAIDSGIIQPLMAFEKRIDPKTNADLIAASTLSLSLRKIEQEKAALQNAKNAEVAAFKAFVQNEFARVVHEYRTDIRKETARYYKSCLETNNNTETELAKKLLKEIAPPKINKFNASYISKEEMTLIYAEIRKPNYEEIISDLLEEFDTMFANFESDVANAAAAIKHQQQQQKLFEMEEEKKLNEEMAINTLIASSESVIVEASKIKTYLQIVVIESESWAKSVISAFIINLPHLTKYIRVKSWSKLSIGQMADYLSKLATDEGVSFPNLQFTEICK